jgi:hypothetical protein
VSGVNGRFRLGKGAGTYSLPLLVRNIFYYILSFIVSVIARRDRAIEGLKMDYPVKPDNDTDWQRVCHE